MVKIKIWHESGWRVDVRPLLIPFLVVIGIAVCTTSKWMEAEAETAALQELLEVQVDTLQRRIQAINRTIETSRQNLLLEMAAARKGYFTNTKSPFYATIADGGDE